MPQVTTQIYFLRDSSLPPAVRKHFLWVVGLFTCGGQAHHPHVNGQAAAGGERS